MCGISGVVYSQPKSHSDKQLLKSMSDSLLHRGPDDEGIYEDQLAGLSFRRLSIISLDNGHQPLHNEDETIWAICNGEIYNYRDLKKDLSKRNHKFYSDSDCEVIPHLYEEYGENFVEKLNGMFALAIWDKKAGKLILARDRMGQKPLYYSCFNGKIMFASELKALLRCPEIGKEINFDSLNKYLTFEYIPAPNTIFKQIKKILPAELLIYENGRISLKNYWRINYSSKSKISEQEAIVEVRSKLIEAVSRRLISDAPLGAFLSGGIDSGLIVSLMTQLSNEKVKCFSIGFDERSFNELEYAKILSKKLNVEHLYLNIKAKDMLELIPQITSFLDEPLADASIIPTYLLSKFTRRHVKVALSGDGGDELFAGYPTYNAHKIARYYKLCPKKIRKNVIDRLINKLPVSTSNISLDFKLKKFISVMDYDQYKRHYLWLGSFQPPEKDKLLSDGVKNEINNKNEFEEIDMYLRDFKSPNPLENILYLDSKLYLQDDILTKVDRASMANSLEVRSPFLDHTFVEYVTSLPMSLKLKGYTNKYILKKMAGEYLPKCIINRPKKGFGLPLAMWFKNDLKSFVLDVLRPSKINSQGYFNANYVQELLNQHFSGKKDNRKLIWTLLVFQMWFDKYLN
ncbi:MAG: asparagine synthase (glutamine-hydrolyzing) [Candidatus Omnitrophica bacterium]|nr:asparagine synthase (glutamine-hydrolyzing) [Candidatus Omnitrophota bacterium]